MRIETSKSFVAKLLSDFFRYQIKKKKQPEQEDMSVVASPATLNASVLSTVSEIPRLSFHCYGSTMATLLYHQQNGLFTVRKCRVSSSPTILTLYVPEDVVT